MSTLLTFIFTSILALGVFNQILVLDILGFIWIYVIVLGVSFLGILLLGTPTEKIKTIMTSEQKDKLRQYSITRSQIIVAPMVVALLATSSFVTLTLFVGSLFLYYYMRGLLIASDDTK